MASSTGDTISYSPHFESTPEYYCRGQPLFLVCLDRPTRCEYVRSSNEPVDSSRGEGEGRIVESSMYSRNRPFNPKPFWTDILERYVHTYKFRHATQTGRQQTADERDAQPARQMIDGWIDLRSCRIDLSTSGAFFIL